LNEPDQLQQRVKALAKRGPLRDTVDMSILHDWYMIDGVLVYFNPKQSIREIMDTWPCYKGCRIDPS
jgi:hypothetical protein